MKKADESNLVQSLPGESRAADSSPPESSYPGSEDTDFRGPRHGTPRRFDLAPERAGLVARVLRIGALAAVLWAAAQPAMGQTAATLERRLEGATRLDCSFSTLVTGDWKDGEPSATVGTATFEASFFDVDVNEGTAEADSRFGSSYIVVRYSHGYLHFMQMMSNGPLRVTTILARETKDGRMMAIHTRHEYSPTVLPGFTSRPEIYIGDCALES